MLKCLGNLQHEKIWKYSKICQGTQKHAKFFQSMRWLSKAFLVWINLIIIYRNCSWKVIFQITCFFAAKVYTRVKVVTVILSLKSYSVDPFSIYFRLKVNVLALGYPTSLTSTFFSNVVRRSKRVAHPWFRRTLFSVAIDHWNFYYHYCTLWNDLKYGYSKQLFSALPSRGDFGN